MSHPFPLFTEFISHKLSKTSNIALNTPFFASGDHKSIDSAQKPSSPPINTSLQDQLESTTKLVHRNLIFTKTNMTFSPTHTLNQSLPVGSYLIATPAGFSQAYLRGTLIVPDDTNIPELVSTLRSQAISQYNTFHDVLPPIYHQPYHQMHIVPEIPFNRGHFEYFSKFKLNPGQAQVELSKAIDQAQRIKSYEPPQSADNISKDKHDTDPSLAPNGEKWVNPNYQAVTANHESSAKSTSTSNYSHFKNVIGENMPELRNPLLALNVPTVIISQYNAVQEQHFSSLLPWLLGGAIAYRVSLLRGLGRPQLHEFLNNIQLNSFQLQKTVATSLGAATGVNQSLRALSLSPLIEIPLLSLFLAPLWGNNSTQTSNSILPYSGLINGLKIETQTQWKDQYLRLYGSYYQNPTINPFETDFHSSTFSTAADLKDLPFVHNLSNNPQNDTSMTISAIVTAHSDVISDISTDLGQPISGSTELSPQSQSPQSELPQSQSPQPESPQSQPQSPQPESPQSESQSPSPHNSISSSPLLSSQPDLQPAPTPTVTSPPQVKTIQPTFPFFGTQYFFLLRKLGLEEYSNIPHIMERYDDTQFIPANQLLNATIQIPTPSAASPSITPWRQAINIERIVCAALVTIAISRYVSIPHRFPKKYNPFYRNNFSPSVSSSSPLGSPPLLYSPFTLLSSLIKRNKIFSQQDNVTRIIPTTFPRFTFPRWNIPYIYENRTISKAVPTDVNTNTHNATNVISQANADANAQTYSSSVSYSTSFVDRSFAQGLLLSKELSKPNIYWLTLRILVLTLGLTQFPLGQFTTEEVIFMNKNDLDSGVNISQLKSIGFTAKDENNDNEINDQNFGNIPQIDAQIAPSDDDTAIKIVSQSTSSTLSPQNITLTTELTQNDENIQDGDKTSSPPVEKIHFLWTSPDMTPPSLMSFLKLYYALLLAQLLLANSSSFHQIKRSPHCEIRQAIERSQESHLLNVQDMYKYSNENTPKAIKTLLKPYLRLPKRTYPLFNRTIHWSAAKKGSILQTIALSFFSTLVVGAGCYYPTYDFIRGNNNGPHPYSPSLFQEYISSPTMEDDTKPILNVLRNNGIEGLFTPHVTPQLIHSGAYNIDVQDQQSQHHHHVVPDQNTTIIKNTKNTNEDTNYQYSAPPHNIDSKLIPPHHHVICCAKRHSNSPNDPPITVFHTHDDLITSTTQPNQSTTPPQEQKPPKHIQSPHSSNNYCANPDCPNSPLYPFSRYNPQIPVSMIQIAYKRPTTYLQHASTGMGSFLKSSKEVLSKILLGLRGGGGGGGDDV